MDDKDQPSGVPVKRGRGRPSTGAGTTSAERMRALRARLREEGLTDVTVRLPVDLVARLEEFLKFKDESKDHAVERALVQFLRKR